MQQNEKVTMCNFCSVHVQGSNAEAAGEREKMTNCTYVLYIDRFYPQHNFT